MASNSFGARLKEIRISTGKTLRDFCLENKFDPGNYSRLERGVLPPPQRRELLEKYLRALGVRPGSDDWLELFDLASAATGQIPPDLQEDEALLAKLPALFRTLRGNAVAADQLDELIDLIRKT